MRNIGSQYVSGRSIIRLRPLNKNFILSDMRTTVSTKFRRLPLISFLMILVVFSVISCAEDKEAAELAGKLINLEKRCLAGLSRGNYDMVWEDLLVEVDRFLKSDKAGDNPEFTADIEESKRHFVIAKNFWHQPEGGWAAMHEDTKSQFFNLYPNLEKNIEDGGAIDPSAPGGINTRAALIIIWKEAKKAAENAAARL